MKDLTRSLLAFVLVYGTKDRKRFEQHAATLLDKYGLEEKDQQELIDFAFGFFQDLGQRFNQIDIISRGVGAGVSDIGEKLDAITEKLYSMESKMNTASCERNGARKH